MRKKLVLKKFTKKEIPKLNFGVLHSQVGFSDGVSIVMKQIEEVLVDELSIHKSNIYYLVGKANSRSPQIRQHSSLWHKNKINQIIQKNFEIGLGGEFSEKVEKEISKANQIIHKFISDKKIDVIIAHNTSHPVNFILSVALSRFYRDKIKRREKVPKYILWWHDSHLERERYKKPSRDLWEYLLEGVPGRFVEYVLFINSMQLNQAQRYLKELDKKEKGFYEYLLKNYSVIYNTATILIDSVEDLKNEEISKRTNLFLDRFGINNLMKKNNLNLENIQFILQHTRVVPRKRIDFALEWSYKLFSSLEKKKMKKACVFVVSGGSGDERGNYKKNLIKLNKKLSEKYNTNKFFLIFSEDIKNRETTFEKIPLIFANLKGISTYFSEIEGFGNNLLEVFAAGLIPAVYTYPVFKKDLAKYKFKAIILDKFEIEEKSIKETIKIIKSENLRKKWSEKNLDILKRKFSNSIIKPKIRRAITKKRRDF